MKKDIGRFITPMVLSAFSIAFAGTTVLAFGGTVTTDPLPPNAIYQDNTSAI